MVGGIENPANDKTWGTGMIKKILLLFQAIFKIIQMP